MNFPRNTNLIVLIAACSCLLFQGRTHAKPFDQKLYDEKARTYSPEESMAMIEMADGYHLELVAAEPMVEEPAAIAWDGDGKLYVAELNTYMQDIDGRNQHAPTSRVVLLEDTDDDGKMDKRSIFVDGLVLPRMIQPIDDRVIIRETNTFDLHSYRDTNGDGVADEKKLVYQGGKRGGNLSTSPVAWNGTSITGCMSPTPTSVTGGLVTVLKRNNYLRALDSGVSPMMMLVATSSAPVAVRTRQ